jgi:ADP-ribose pyrophosphatase YjhB (NUDIX family)
MTIELSGCAIVDDEQRLLVIHRDTPELVQWEIIGGKVEPNETSEAAATREAREEIGTEVEIIRELGGQPFPQNDRDYFYTWWLAKIVNGKPYPQEAKFDVVGWFTVNQLRRRDDLSPNLRNLVKKLVDGEVSLTV